MVPSKPGPRRAFFATKPLSLVFDMTTGATMGRDDRPCAGPSRRLATSMLGLGLGLGLLRPATGIFYLPGVAPKSYSKGDQVRQCFAARPAGGIGSHDGALPRVPGQALREQAHVHKDADPVRLLLAPLQPSQQNHGNSPLGGMCTRKLGLTVSDVTQGESENLGEVLSGDRIEKNSLYDVSGLWSVVLDHGVVGMRAWGVGVCLPAELQGADGVRGGGSRDPEPQAEEAVHQGHQPGVPRPLVRYDPPEKDYRPLCQGGRIL
jgi:hypothetical protein